MTPITVGSSDVASILGLSPWAGPAKTWARLTGLVPRYDSVGTDATTRGRIMEPALLGEWARRRRPLGCTAGPTIDEPPQVRDAWKSARVDMLAVLDDGSRLVVEAKTTRSWDGWGESGTTEVPIYYAAQVAWQMHVLDCDLAEVVAYSPMDDQVRIYPLARDRALEVRLVAAVERWMEAHVWCEPPVQPLHMPLDVLERVYGGGGGNKVWVDADPKTREIAEKLAKVRAQIDALEVDEERLKAALCERIGDGYGIRGVATWGQVKGRETVTMADLKAEHPAIYASLAKRGGSYRMFRLLIKETDNDNDK